VSGKAILEWSELEDSIHQEWVEANFWLLKFLVISIQSIKLPKKLQSLWFLSSYMTIFFVTLHCSRTCAKLFNKWSTLGGSTITLCNALPVSSVQLVSSIHVQHSNHHLDSCFPSFSVNQPNLQGKRQLSLIHSLLDMYSRVNLPMTSWTKFKSFSTMSQKIASFETWHDY